ncbi:Uncharacterised protein [Nocardia africana]|uniref:Uncharacterized protein n=1 Tax=Nocardia africana TaxID=134964 RepID=A0A378WVD2_9NOCA|nr:Uncharacterised protein [Nocardia africana]
MLTTGVCALAQPSRAQASVADDGCGKTRTACGPSMFASVTPMP